MKRSHPRLLLTIAIVGTIVAAIGLTLDVINFARGDNREHILISLPLFVGGFAAMLSWREIYRGTKEKEGK